MAAPNLVKIIFASEFKAKGLNQADKAVTKLNKNVKNLAGAFGLAFGTRALAIYSKNAVKAFAADEKAARSLSLTLKNLGLAFADPKVKQFISDMEQQYHVVDDLLRPAFQKFLTVTGSVAKSQSLLQSALNASAATGQDLDSVTSILTKAYLGQTKGLSKLGISLTQAQMKAMSFEEILSLINKTFAGQAQEAANSYKGKIDALNVSLANAQEIIGKGIIDALQTLSGDKSFSKVTGEIENMSLAIADTVRGIGILSGKIANSWFGQLLGGAFKSSPIGALTDFLTKAGKAQRIAEAQANTGGGLGGSQSMADRLSATRKRQELEAEKKAARERAKQLAAQKALTKAQQDALKEKKLAGLFDIQQAEIMAALQGKITNEEKLRLELMLAMEQGNVNEAEKLAQKLAAAQGQTSLLSTYLRTLPEAANPFASWSAYLKGIEDQIARIAGARSGGAGNGGGGGGNGGGGNGGGGNGGGGMDTPATNVDYSGFATNNPSFQFGSSTPWAQAAQNFTITVEGGDELTTLMRYKIAEASSSGSGVNWSQTVGAYDR